jgi:branched-chain amino acid transport system ATP-binding protein
LAKNLLLEVTGVDSFYGLSQALFGVGLELAEGEIVCLLGRNGAGKTTTLRSIMGLTAPRRGRVTFADQDITGWRPRRGVPRWDRLGAGGSAHLRPADR